jgi:hypothetical protein
MSQINLKTFPLYALPKLDGWHNMVSKEPKEKGKLYEYFGYNWWDLFLNNKLPIKYGSITINPNDTHMITIVNMGKDLIKIKEKNSGDIYNVPRSQKSIVNNTTNKNVILKANKRKCEMLTTYVGNVCLVMVQLEDIRKEKWNVKKTTIYTDFLLMNGIPDTVQYLNTVGIENLTFIDSRGWKFKEEDSGSKIEFSEILIDRWKKINPTKKPETKVSIPLKVHWIWLRLNLDGKYGELPDRFFKFMDTWINHNQNFEFNIWTDNEDFKLPEKYENVIKVNGPGNIEKLFNKLPPNISKKIKFLYKNHKNVGARSDTLRQAILHIIGGMYSDINDGSCLMSLEQICNKFDFLIGLEPVMYVNNAIIGSAPKHDFTKNMLVWLANNSKDFVEEWDEDYTGKDVEQDEKDDYIVSTTGPIAMTYCIFGALKKKEYNSSLILPSSWIYPNYWVKESPVHWLKPVSLTAHFDARDYLA